MKNTGQDNRFLAEAISQLQDYLLSNELYWPLSGSLPRLTPGSVLLTLARISVLQPDEARRLNVQFEAVRIKWESAWNKKVAREIANRLRLWSQFVTDYKNSPDQNADSYPNEARGRVILQLLLNELPDASEKDVLEQLDVAIRARLVPDVFLWEAELQTVFPAREFWFFIRQTLKVAFCIQAIPDLRRMGEIS